MYLESVENEHLKGKHLFMWLSNVFTHLLIQEKVNKQSRNWLNVTISYPPVRKSHSLTPSPGAVVANKSYEYWLNSLPFWTICWKTREWASWMAIELFATFMSNISMVLFVPAQITKSLIEKWFWIVFLWKQRKKREEFFTRKKRVDCR